MSPHVCDCIAALPPEGAFAPSERSFGSKNA
jgi:hypothetical protein